jgi:lipopolysaccharide transport system ATP-binding protein
MDTFWALQDINFDIFEGECVGIIGRNGAGKSTLLKILSQITPPTKGYIKARGRVASLLEVGTGFHPELTGRENVYLNGSILGLKRSEINSKFDEIIDFSGIEKFLDTPLKHYSSGMKLRLAFSVAAHLEPEILLIDEVLAVGDAEFQKKCLGKMDEVSKSGRTVLFVSHNLGTVRQLCEKSILLSKGKVKNIALTNTIIDNYLSDKSLIKSIVEFNPPYPGSGVTKLIRASCINKDSSNKFEFEINQQIGIKITYKVLLPSNILHFGIRVYNQEDINIFDAHSVTSSWYSAPHPTGIYHSTAWIPGNLLSSGLYSISVAIFNHNEHTIHFSEEKCLYFSIIETPFNSNNPTARGTNQVNFNGIVRPLLKWETKLNKN